MSHHYESNGVNEKTFGQKVTLSIEIKLIANIDHTNQKEVEISRREIGQISNKENKTF